MCRQDMGHLTAWATDSRQILWRRGGETVIVRLQECMTALCQSIWRFGQISCRKPDKMVQDNKSTQPARCLGMLCGTSAMLCARKTVPHYMADPGFLPVNQHQPLRVAWRLILISLCNLE